MLSRRMVAGKKSKDEGEKPFWISFADLMSALMVLFLLVMSVALLSITKNVPIEVVELPKPEPEPINIIEQKKAQRENEIQLLLSKIEEATIKYPGITLDKNRNAMNFGDKARFESGSSQLSEEQAESLRQFVPEILAIGRNELGQKWLKRIIVEGFADQRGDYLLNLNLSLQRSQRVLCALLDPKKKQGFILNKEELEQVRDLFLVGGYSFNSAKSSLEESRRIEFRLEFFSLDEEHPTTENIPRNDFGTCRI